MNNKHPDIIDVIIKDSTLIFSDQLIKKLNAKPGDRISIGYIKENDKLIPIVELGETGTLLRNNNSISFRGKQREILGQFGTNFWFTEKDGKLLLDGDGLPIYTTVKKAVEYFITQDIIEDRTYNITKLNNYEF